MLCGDLPGAVKVSQSMVDNNLPLGVVELPGSANDACHSFEGLLVYIIELDDGKFYRKAPYVVGKSTVSCKISLKPIQSYRVYSSRL